MGGGNWAKAMESIIWYQPDFPPFVTIDDTGSEQGIDNQIVETVAKHLPGYNHQYVVANYTRILRDLKAEQPGVVTPLFKTPERERYLYYSEVASYLVFPSGLICRREDQNKFSAFLLENGSVDLWALCKSGNYKLAYASGRSYYGIIDEVLSQVSNETYIFSRTASDQIGTLKMLKNGRIDATFGFPVEIKYAGLEQELTFMPVSGMPAYIPVFFGAPKNPWGKSIINKLNMVLSKQGILDLFASYYRCWLEDNTIQHYEHLRNSYYRGTVRR